MRTVTALALIAGLCWAGLARAQDIDAVLTKQREAAKEAAAEVDILKPGTAESEHLIVVSDLPQKQVDELTKLLEQRYAVVRKVLRFDDSDKPWTGKLTVYLFQDRSTFTSFLRKIEKRAPADRDESVSGVWRGETPHLTVAVGLGEDVANLPAKSLKQMAVALLNIRAGGTAQLPKWVEDGFARTLTIRLDPRGHRKERLQMQQLARAGQMKWIWGDSPIDDDGLLAASFVDYLTFGTEGETFTRFLRAFTPGEGNQQPTVTRAFEAAEIDPMKVEYAWKRWALSGK